MQIPTNYGGPLAAACSGPEARGPAVEIDGYTSFVYSSYCRDGTSTGYGQGYKHCVDLGLQREAVARA